MTMNLRFSLAFLPFLALGCPGGDDDPESCDLDTFFADPPQAVNCIENEAGSGEFTCTCPDGTTFASSDTCSKSDQDQGELIDNGCPIEE